MLLLQKGKIVAVLNVLTFVQRWWQEVGCLNNVEELRELWVELVGVPSMLWIRETLKRT